MKIARHDIETPSVRFVGLLLRCLLGQVAGCSEQGNAS